MNTWLKNKHFPNHNEAPYERYIYIDIYSTPWNIFYHLCKKYLQYTNGNQDEYNRFKHRVSDLWKLYKQEFDNEHRNVKETQRSKEMARLGAIEPPREDLEMWNNLD